ncbi:hypothetical protein NDU88_010765 [Pleurodeles waltl]|uniref:Uncharacterized protein n=1 Tax=Pleurodeles waltl TaxID=8319 RepID=A0AAV7S1L0_PLEWA|nr:hypothetical protein NDU88_010765 [Pleurodeles waltl]
MRLLHPASAPLSSVISLGYFGLSALVRIVGGALGSPVIAGLPACEWPAASRADTSQDPCPHLVSFGGRMPWNPTPRTTAASRGTRSSHLQASVQALRSPSPYQRLSVVRLGHYPGPAACEPQALLLAPVRMLASPQAPLIGFVALCQPPLLD